MGLVEFPRKVQTFSIGENHRVEIYHIPDLEGFRAEFHLRQGRKIVHKETFYGAAWPRWQKPYQAVTESKSRLVALVRVDEPRIILVLCNFESGECWTGYNDRQELQRNFTQFQQGFPNTFYALYGTEEAAKIMRDEK